MKTLSGFFIAWAFIAPAALAQTNNDLTLSHAVNAALETQPVMRSSQLGIDLAEKRVDEARTGQLPTVRITETITRGNNPVFVFGSLLEQARFGPQNFALPMLNNPPSLTNLRSAVSASVPVFDGLKTSIRIGEAGIARDQAIFQRTLAEQQVRFEVLRQYFAVLVAEANHRVAGEAVRMAESDLQRTQDRLEAGLAVESDRLAAQVQLAEFTQQQIEAEGKLATAYMILNVSTGSPLQARHNLTGVLIKKNFPLSQLNVLVDRAMRHRPDYADAQSGIQLAERHAAGQRNAYLPEANVFASFGASGRNWTTGSTDYLVGAGVTFNLLDPGRASRIGQAEIQRNLAQTARDRVRDQIMVEVARAYHQYRSALQQVEVAEAALSQAAEALRIIQNRYEAGLTTITDLLRAETALVRARINVTSANEAQYVGYANILLATGELNDVHDFES